MAEFARVAIPVAAAWLWACKGSPPEQQPVAATSVAAALESGRDAALEVGKGTRPAGAKDAQPATVPRPLDTVAPASDTRKASEDAPPERAAFPVAAAEPIDRGTPVATDGVDLDRDGSLEIISLWCNAEDGQEDGQEDDQEEPAELTVQVGDAVMVVRPSLSDMIGCAFETTAPRRGPRLLWVTAQEHEEVGASTHYLLRYERESLSMVWKETAEVSWDDDNTWSTEAWFCDAEERRETTLTTDYRFVRGKIKEKTSRTSKPIDPSDCETFDP